VTKRLSVLVLVVEVQQLLVRTVVLHRVVLVVLVVLAQPHR
jgi:hypothetical protein